MPRFYHMGGAEPFVLAYSSTEYIIMPPDKRWKRVDEEYSPGIMSNGKPLVLKRKVWKEDDSPKGRKPVSYLDLTDDQAAYLKSGKFHAEREYIKSAEEIGKQLDAEHDDTIEKHAAKMAEIERQFTKDLEARQAEHARVMAELAKSVSLPQPAPRK